jgi:WD40 repeat protein
MPAKEGELGSQKTVSAVCALGSQDNSVSIWYTAMAKSLAVTQNIFNYAVLDMDWSRDGLNLYMSSYDGTVACLCFEEEEFGTPLSSEETVNEVFKFCRNVLSHSTDIEKVRPLFWNPPNSSDWKRI